MTVGGPPVSHHSSPSIPTDVFAGQTLNFNLEVAELVPLFAICLDGGLPKCILRTEWDQAELEFKSIKEALNFQSAMTGYEVYKDYSKYAHCVVSRSHGQNLISTCVGK